MECTCKDWKENIDKLNEGWVFVSIHGGKGYTGKIFIYCPWCSKPLIKEEELDGTNN